MYILAKTCGAFLFHRAESLNCVGWWDGRSPGVCFGIWASHISGECFAGRHDGCHLCQGPPMPHPILHSPSVAGCTPLLPRGMKWGDLQRHTGKRVQLQAPD